MGKTAEKEKAAPTLPPHDHVHKRKVMEAEMALDAPDRHGQFRQCCGMLMENLQIADPTVVYNTLDPTNLAPDVQVGTRVLPNNFTKLGLYITIDGKGDEFDAARDRKPQQNQKGSDARDWRGDNNKEEKQKEGANIYFKFVMSCDKSTAKIVQSVF